LKLVVDYELDYKSDKFWAEKMGEPFYKISEDIAKETDEWFKEYNSMGHKKLVSDVKIIMRRLIS